jgi:hypothetical protein
MELPRGGTMRKARFALAGCLALVLGIASLAAEVPAESEKKDVAIFALGYHGWDIPLETLGSIDQGIQKAFVGLDRLNIIGVDQRLSSGGLDSFIAALKQAKEANFVMPDKYQFGEATLTGDEVNKLLGAFIVAVPVVSEFNSEYDSYKSQWDTNIKTYVTFIDVASGGMIGVAEVESSGTDISSQRDSISSAIDAIPIQLQFEIHKIKAFQFSTKVLAISDGQVTLQLGKNIGIKKGDEYSIIKTENEEGLVRIKDVGSEVSTGHVVYSGIPLTMDLQLKEIPRLGFDMEPYFHTAGDIAIPGIRAVVSRGYYGFRPYAAVQIPVSQVSSYWRLFAVIPVNAIVGGEYNFCLGRLTLTPFGGIGAGYARVVSPLNDSDTTDWLSHIGAQAYVRASFLVSRDIRFFVEGGAEFWIAMNQTFFNNYGSLGNGGGVAIKL